MGPHLLADGRLFPRGRSPAAPLLRPGDAQQTPLGEQPAELLRELEVRRVGGEGAEEVGGDLLPDQLAKAPPQLADLFPHVELHDPPR